MSIISDKKKISKLLDFYEQYLKTVKEETFLTSPQQGIWSYSEIYSHVLWVIASSLVAIEQSLNKTSPIKSNPADWRVRLILFLGILPGSNLKAPEIAAANVKKISKEEALNKIFSIRKRLDTICREFKKFDPNYKVKHPRLGWLNAKQWLRFIVVHTKHHIKQISRLEKLLEA
jgi:hypothetical protein